MSVWNPTTTDRRDSPSLQHNSITGELVVVTRRQDPASGTWSEQRRPVPADARAVFDFGSLETGPIKFGKGTRPDFSKLRAYGQPQLDVGDDPDYREGFRLLVLVQGFGRVPLVFCNNATMTNMRLRAAFDDFNQATEAVTGPLPVYIITTSAPVRVARSDTSYFPLALEGPVNWFDRDPAIFGERLVPPPTVRIAGDNAVKSDPPKRSADPRYNIVQTREGVIAAVKVPSPKDEDPLEDDSIPF